MQSTYNTISKTQKEVEVSLTAEEFLPYLDKAANELSKNLEVQGFRKGHVPRDIVEQKVGSSALYGEAADYAVKDTYQEALKASNNDNSRRTNGVGLPAGEAGTPTEASGLAVPEVQVTKLAPGNPFSYKVIFFMPHFEIVKNYRGIAKKAAAGKKSVVVEDREVEETLRWLSKNRKSGKEKDVEINDEFARSVGDFNNLEELKHNIREGIIQEKEKKEKDRVRLKIVKDIAVKSIIDIPEKVIYNEVLKIEDEFKHSIAQMGLEFEDYLSKISAKGGKKTKEEFRDNWKDQAKDRVEMSLILDVVARGEEIEPIPEEIEEESKKILKRFQGVEEAKNSVDPARLRSHVYAILKNEKTLKFLESL